MKNLKNLITYLLVICLIFPVVPKNYVAAKSIKLSSTSITLYVGQTKTIKLKGTKKAPKWNSSKKSVATVTNKGKIKAKKQGNAVIMAKIGKKSYKCRVKVKSVIPVTPTKAPTEEPTIAPTKAPTEEPTIAPTEAPTEKPTIAPTEAPTEKPTIAPTVTPTEKPTIAPTEAPVESTVTQNYKKLSNHIQKNGKYDSDGKYYYIDDIMPLDSGDIYMQIRYNLDGSFDFSVMITMDTAYGTGANLVSLTITPPEFARGEVAEMLVSDITGLRYANGVVNLSSLSQTNSKITYTSTNASTISEKNDLYELGETYLALGLPSWTLLLRTSGSGLSLKDLGFTSYDI